LLRTDSWGDPLAYRENSFIVTLGAGRRETGTHYTPKTLAEPIVQHTLEPLVYVGPSKGKPQTEWRLKSPREILALKVCDMAMGSAAFLVQTCRWLGDRLVEAWDVAERAGHTVSVEGEVLEQPGNTELLPRDQAERVLIARRLIASRCLYGVDKNPMAVEPRTVAHDLISRFEVITVETKNGDFVPDITLASKDDRQHIFVEFKVTHECSAAKRGWKNRIIEISIQREEDLQPFATTVFLLAMGELNSRISKRTFHVICADGSVSVSWQKGVHQTKERRLQDKVPVKRSGIGCGCSRFNRMDQEGVYRSARYSRRSIILGYGP
jgi:hypothetical protein